MKSKKCWYLLLLALLLLVVSASILQAEPHITDLRKSDNPLLKKALSYDLDRSINPPMKVKQRLLLGQAIK